MKFRMDSKTEEEGDICHISKGHREKEGDIHETLKGIREKDVRFQREQ